MKIAACIGILPLVRFSLISITCSGFCAGTACAAGTAVGANSRAAADSAIAALSACAAPKLQAIRQATIINHMNPAFSAGLSGLSAIARSACRNELTCAGNGQCRPFGQIDSCIA